MICSIAVGKGIAVGKALEWMAFNDMTKIWTSDMKHGMKHNLKSGSS